MTVRELLSIVARRWYITLATVLLAVMLAAFLVQQGGVYSSRATIDFRWPGSARIETNNGFTSESVISFADIVARRVNHGREAAHYSQDTAPLYGAGLREGEVVGLSFVGNQWVSDNPVAAIAVQVIGRTAADVKANQTKLIAEVLRTADKLQLETGAAPAGLMVRAVEPLSTQIVYIGPTRITRLAAFTALGAAGLISGVGLALVCDRELRRARQPRVAR